MALISDEDIRDATSRALSGRTLSAEESPGASQAAAACRSGVGRAVCGCGS